MIVPYLSLGDNRYLDSAGKLHTIPGDDPIVEFEAVKLDVDRPNRDLYAADWEHWDHIAGLGGHRLADLVSSPPPPGFA